MLKCNKKILKRLKQKKKGLSIIEVVVALSIIGIMIIPLGAGLISSVKANKMGEIKQKSKLISQEIIEKIRVIGDVKETTLKVGEYFNDINITKNQTGFEVSGVINDKEKNIEVTGSIEPQGIFTEDLGSLNYKKKEFGLFIYVQNGENGNDNKITYWTADKVPNGEKKTIDNYLNLAKAPTVINDCTELNIEIGESPTNKLKVNGDDAGLLIGLADSSSLGNIGVYVEGQRESTKLIKLKLNNKNSDSSKKVNMYFFNNKFHGVSHESSDPVTDSFKEDRYINGPIEIIDNIVYYPTSTRINKGLYTIKLSFTKSIPNGASITENTRSEFMVDN